MVLKPQEATDACYQAGFRYNTGIIIMPCIGWAESRLRSDARHTNPDGSVDRGWLQINDRAHPEVTDEMADDPVDAAVAAFHISQQGTNFRPWSAYLSNAYKGPESLAYLLFTESARAYYGNLTVLEMRDHLAALDAENDRLADKIVAARAALA